MVDEKSQLERGTVGCESTTAVGQAQMPARNRTCRGCKGPDMQIGTRGFRKEQHVDPSFVNGLIFSGIINVLVQHDANKKKGIALEHENKTVKVRLESLETWTNRQSEYIKNINDELDSLDEDGIEPNRGK